ncbi:hypothetical protein OS12_05910 [Dickeya oryzae]
MFDVVELSRLQFALTAMYHFLFVPLTLGMAFFAGDHGNRVCLVWQTNLQRYDQVLGQVVCD